MTAGPSFGAPTPNGGLDLAVVVAVAVAVAVAFVVAVVVAVVVARSRSSFH